VSAGRDAAPRPGICDALTVREARFVGLSADGAALIVEARGEHLRVPLDATLRDAVSGPDQPALAFSSPVTPREIQRRIRAGETAGEIAASSGVSVERIARFERPVLEERAHQAARARAVVVRAGQTLEELAEEHGARQEPGATLSWDARLADDGTWRLVLLYSTGVAACWSWVPASRLIAPMERVARAVSDPDGPGAPGDVLQAVLRPLGSVPRRLPTPPDAADPDAGLGTGEDSTDPPAAGLAEGDPGQPGSAPADPPGRAGPLRRARSRGRAEVPSWDDIAGGTTRRGPGRG